MPASLLGVRTLQEDSMSDSRRQLLVNFARTVAIASILATTLFVSAAQTPQPIPSPNAPTRNFPHRIGDPEPTGPDAKAIDKQNQAEIKLEVQKLSDLVSELKEQVDKNDATATLPVSVVKKAQQIEKLAKQIKDRAKS
jgi:hypothetical protein